jgi:hypothetical protein
LARYAYDACSQSFISYVVKMEHCIDIHCSNAQASRLDSTQLGHRPRKLLSGVNLGPTGLFARPDQYYAQNAAVIAHSVIC